MAPPEQRPVGAFARAPLPHSGRIVPSMLLYHFTDAEHWPAILGSGEIRNTWRRRDSPPTAHFTVDPDPASLPWGHRERRIRVMVRVPGSEAQAWIPWSQLHLLPEEKWSLAAPSDPTRTSRPNQWNGSPEAWRVVERSVPMAEWMEAVDLSDFSVPLWPIRPA